VGGGVGGVGYMLNTAGGGAVRYMLTSSEGGRRQIPFDSY
jgi:hypothetical protein